MSESNRIIIRAVPEVTPGTTPVDDAGWFIIPQNGDSLTASPETVQSQRIRGTDRLPYDLVQVGNNVGGGVDIELSMEDFDVLLAAAMRNDWATDVLSVGTDKPTFTIEKEHADISKFLQLKGCQLSQLDLSFTAKQIVTGNMQFLGLTAVADGSTSLVGAGSVAALSGNDVLAANVDMQSISYDGSPVGSMVVRQIDLSINNNLRTNDSLLAIAAADVLAGTANVSGRLSLYTSADGWAVYEDMLANEAVSLAWTIQDAAGNSYAFNLPQIKLSGTGPTGPGENQDSMIEVDFLCVQTTPTITRVIA